MRDFKDKVVYITGGSSGIGLAFAKLMAAKGAVVIIFARRRQALDEALKEVSASGGAAGRKHACIVMDVADREQVKSVLAGAVAEYGVPDVLVNCAGRAIPRYFEDVSYEQFDETLKVDLYGTWNTTSVLAPLMKERGGYIVNVSSIVGFVGIFGYTDYAAAKFGVMGFSEALRSELKRYNIAVSVLCPPDTDTPGFAEENKTKPPETKAISASASLMKPADVALSLLKGMAKKESIIIPNADGRFTHIMKRLLPGLVELVTDAQARKAQQPQNFTKNHREANVFKKIDSKLIAALEIATAGGLSLFWLAFFTVGLAPVPAPPCYFAYEHSFPLPDGFLAILLLIAGILLMLNKPWGGKLSMVAAGALVFLGLVDFSFNIQNGMYMTSTVDLVLNAFINVWCVGFGLAIAVIIGRKPDA